jgi:hypothetical protein
MIGDSVMLLFELRRRYGSVEDDRHVIAKKVGRRIDGDTD